MNKETERLKADNLTLENILTPRRWIGPSGRGSPSGEGLFEFGKIYGEIRKHPKTVALIQVVPDFEAKTLAMDVLQGLTWAAWYPRLIDAAESGIPAFSIPRGYNSGHGNLLIKDGTQQKR